MHPREASRRRFLSRAVGSVIEELEGRAYFSIPAAPIDLDAATVNGGTISVAWTDESSNETGFRIERSTGGGSYSQVATVNANVSTYSNSGLAASTAYSYRVRAYNTDGNSAYTDIASATTAAAPAAPSGLAASNITTTGMTFNWTNNDGGAAISYALERSVDGGSTWTKTYTAAAGVSTYTVSNLTAGTSYTWRVRAYNGAFSDSSNVVTAATIAAPAAPSGLAATTLSATQVSLAWTNNDSGESAATAYKIDRSTDGGTTFTNIASVGVGVSTYTSSSLTAGTTYTYRVRAYNGSYSPASNFASATTLATPAAPSALTATPASTSRIDLAWTANDGGIATSYLLEKSVNGGTNYSTVATLSPGVTTYSAIGLSSLTSYQFRVRAYDGVYSASSNLATATPGDVIAGPKELTATVVSTSELDLNWIDTTSDETGFIVQKFVSNAWSTIATLSPDVTTYAVTGLTNNSTTSYRVAAVKDGVISMTSNVVAAKAGVIDPGAGTYVVTLGGLVVDAGSHLQNVDDHLALVGDGTVTAVNLQDAIAKAIAGNAYVHAKPGSGFNDNQDRTFVWDLAGAATSTNQTAFELGALTAVSGTTGLYSGKVTLEDTFGWSGSDEDYNDDSWAVTVQYVPTVTVSAPTAAANEAGPVAQSFTFTRTGATTQALIVQYSLSGDATIDTDYSVAGDDTASTTATNRQITFAAGSSTATVTITPKTDALVEATEHVTAVVQSRLSSSDPLYVPSGSATIDILDA